MAEAFGVAASALSLVGLTGQMIQGCQYVRDFFDDLKDAPADIRSLQAELALFQLMLESIEKLLTDFDCTDPKTDAFIRQILNFSNEAVGGLKLLTKKHGRRSLWWRNINFVSKTTRFAKYLDRMERAKGFIHVAQSNLDFYVRPHRIQDLRDDSSSLPNPSSIGQDPILQAPVSLVQTPSLMEQSQSDSASETTSTAGKVLESSDMLLPDSRHISLQRNTFLMGESRQQVIYCQAIERTLCALLGIQIVSVSKKTRHKSYFASNEEDTQWEINGYKSLTLILNLWLWNMAIVFSRIEDTILQQSSFKVEIRVYNIVKMESAIVQACKLGDLQRVKQLFLKGEASPFDQVDNIRSSLLEIAAWQLSNLWRSDWRRTRRDPYTYCKLIEFLVSCGLDPGKRGFFRYGYSFLGLLEFDSRNCAPQHVPSILTMARFVLKHSKTDPFQDLDVDSKIGIPWFKNAYGRDYPFGDIVVGQEDWPVHWPPQSNTKPPQIYSPRSIYHLSCDPLATTTRKALRITDDVGLNSINAEFLLGATYGYVSNQYTILLNTERTQRMIKAQIHAFLDYGINLRTILPTNFEECQTSLLSSFRTYGALPMLKSVLQERLWSDDEIEELFEEDLYCSLAYQLFALDQCDRIYCFEFRDGSSKRHVDLSYIAIPDLFYAAYLRSYPETGSEFKSSDTGATEVHEITSMTLKHYLPNLKFDRDGDLNVRRFGMLEW